MLWLIIASFLFHTTCGLHNKREWTERVSSPTYFPRLTKSLRPITAYFLLCSRPEILERQAVEAFRYYTFYRIPNRKDTVGRTKAFLRCYNRNIQRLTVACNSNQARFDRTIKRVFRSCVNEELTSQEKKQNSSYRFDTKKCDTSILYATRNLPAPIDVAVSCRCEQPQNYTVSRGTAGYVIRASPLGNLNELRAIAKCVRKSRANLSRTCRRSPLRFSLLAAQTLQACCKRVRAGSGRKFECKDIVPDDISVFRDG